jgi:hypothetical protein
MAKRNALADGSTTRAESAPEARRAWLAARERARCTKGDFQVTGADIARIARTMFLDPRHFTQTAPAQADDPVGINVHQGRRRVTLGLATGTNGCVFLLRTTGGACLCGLGSLAPLSCQLFTPEAEDRTEAEDRARAIDAGERPGPDQAKASADGSATPQGPVDATDEMDRQASAELSHWQETVNRWNALGASRPGADLSVDDFQRYLLEADAARLSGAPWPEEVTA